MLTTLLLDECHAFIITAHGELIAPLVCQEVIWGWLIAIEETSAQTPVCVCVF